MIKEMRGWKVISEITRESCRAGKWVNGYKWAVIYSVGLETFPKVTGTKLFFFRSYNDAKEFSGPSEIIVPCIAKNATKVKWVGGNRHHIDLFWKQRRKSIDKVKQLAPEGTYFAESITCLE